MALKCIVLENNPDKEVRHAAVLEAVRKYFGNNHGRGHESYYDGHRKDCRC